MSARKECTAARSGRTTTMTIVLCPREKNSPHVTGSCPRLMRPRVALSIALDESSFVADIKLCGGEEDNGAA